jgi:hypothetical protein
VEAAVKRRELERVLHAAGEHLTGRDTRPGVLARQLLEREQPGDTRLAEILVSERRARTRMDGSIDGLLVKTAWAALEIMDLGADSLHGGLDRLVSWSLAEVVSSPPPPDGAPVDLPNGTRITDPDGAAFAARCLGLRLLLRARKDGRPGVAKLVEELADGPQPPTLDLSACALAALALMPPPHRRHLDGLINRLGKAQETAGGWAEADLFLMLEALVLAGVRPARAVVVRAAPALAALQQTNGGFDDLAPNDPVHEERTLIGLRALHIAVED